MAPDREFSADAKTFLSQTLTDQIQLVSIVPDGLTGGKDFGTDVEAALSWAQRQSDRGKNIYWAVNPTEFAVSLTLRPISYQAQNITTVVTPDIVWNPEDAAGTPWTLFLPQGE